MHLAVRTFLMTFVALPLLCVGTLPAADPFLEKVDVFSAGTGGYAIYRIPCVVVTRSGTVLVCCEARKDGGDWSTIDILLKRSTDGGRTWAAPQKVADVPGPKTRNPIAVAMKRGKPDDVTYNNPLLIADRNGEVHLLFCLDYGRAFYSRSRDDGQTWSAATEITGAFEAFRPKFDWKVLATGPGHGIQLKSGRLVVPVWLSTGTGGNAHRPSITATIVSDDWGRNWRAGEVAVPNTEEWINPNETVAVELADGRVMLNVRSESVANRRIVVTSADGATGWSAPRFDKELVEPVCMASILRLSTNPPSDRNRLLFANPDNLSKADGNEKPGGSRDRQNLSLKLSLDEGATWPVTRPLEPGFSAYSDLALLADGTILCFYERGQKPQEGKKPLNYTLLTLARFNLEWLTRREDTLSAP
jgi:sialidase-1